MAFWKKKPPLSGNDDPAASDASADAPQDVPPTTPAVAAPAAAPSGIASAAPVSNGDAIAAPIPAQAPDKISPDAASQSTSSGQPVPTQDAPRENSAQPQQSGQAGGPTITSAIAAALGKVIAVLMYVPRFKTMTMPQMTNRVLPALIFKQFIVAEARRKDTDVAMPIGVLLWARVSDEQDQLLIASQGEPVSLMGDLWNSGDHLWIIETAGPPDIIKAMVRQLVEGPFKDQAFKFRTQAADGSSSVELFDPKVMAQMGAPDAAIM